MKNHIRVHKEEDGFGAECGELEGCVTKDGFPFPGHALDTAKRVLSVSVDPEMALAA